LRVGDGVMVVVAERAKILHRGYGGKAEGNRRKMKSVYRRVAEGAERDGRYPSIPHRGIEG